jgi:hypothetical protein
LEKINAANGHKSHKYLVYVWGWFSGNSSILKFVVFPIRFTKCLGVCVPLRPPRKKALDNSTNENNIKSSRINNHTVYNQISIANEFNNYFSNIVESTSIKGINAKAKDACPLQYLFKYFKQSFKDINRPYTSSKEINKIMASLKNKNSSGYDEITTTVIL